MVIENSERFGLAQLHQLRGRVGRGEKESFCILMHSNSLNELSEKRLEIITETNDGFVIAEEDEHTRICFTLSKISGLCTDKFVKKLDVFHIGANETIMDSLMFLS